MTEVPSKANYENYETLADQLRIGRLDNLVCTDCGILVVDKAAHDRLHSVMSSWAWALAILKTNHAAAHLHDQYKIVERINSKTFVPASCENKDDEKHETSHPDRYEIAWKLWSWTEELYIPTQRSSGNWLKLGDDQLTKRERDDRDLYLSRADQMIGMAGKRDYVRFLDNGTFRCLEPECERQPEYENIDQVFIHARHRHEIDDVLIESPKNEENKS